MADMVPHQSIFIQKLPLPKAFEKELLALAVNFSEDAIMITTTDLDAPGPTIVYANPAFMRMTGYLPHETIGHSPRMLQGPRTDWELLKEMREVLERGEVFLPAFKKLKRKGSILDQKYLDVLERGLVDLASGFGGKMATLDSRLSPREVEIANLVRNGLNNKEIGLALNLSVKTVEMHRNRIRSKLKIKSR